MNNVVLVGRLTKDPEVRTGGNTTIASSSIAVDRRFKSDGQPDADFFTVKAFGKTAEFFEKYLQKGTKIALVGELRNNNYTDKDGVKHYNVEVVVNTVEFAESKKASDQGEQKRDDGFVNIPDDIDDELPFN